MALLTLYRADDDTDHSLIWALEELGLEYTINIIDDDKSLQTKDLSTTFNIKDIPAVDFGDKIVFRNTTILLALSYHQKTPIAPAPGEYLHKNYLKWMLYCEASFKPILRRAVAAHSDQDKLYSMTDFKNALGYLEKTLQTNGYILSNDFSIADIRLVKDIDSANDKKLLNNNHIFLDYIKKCHDRLAFQKTKQIIDAMHTEKT